MDKWQKAQCCRSEKAGADPRRSLDQCKDVVRPAQSRRACPDLHKVLHLADHHRGPTPDAAKPVWVRVLCASRVDLCASKLPA
eukprot:1160531-Pelagomonas_calceolata.AAC.9